jgi:beta-galactosidase
LKRFLLVLPCLLFVSIWAMANPRPGKTIAFGELWRFHLGDISDGQRPDLDDSKWRSLNVPHDWSIEGQFSEKSPAGTGGGALPGGIGWYRKAFLLPVSAKGKSVFIEFDGVYRNSEVWINGQYLGKRPYGYSSFRYELTRHLNFGNQRNVIAVKVDNSQQPNSRWYSGSGIYRNVWLTTVEPIHVDHWGTWIRTPAVTEQAARVIVETTVLNQTTSDLVPNVTTIISDSRGREIGRVTAPVPMAKDSTGKVVQEVSITEPTLWSPESPNLYKAVTQVAVGARVTDRYETSFGVRYFSFDPVKGFLLNGQKLKILGVCNHHDLGSLGAAVNTRAIERQLEILKAMGANSIRTSHNPPAPELLELADKMGLIVMDEAFDIWKKEKNKFDYHLDWDEWHKRDLEDMVLRDRNHPSVFIWSIGNEVAEQWNNSSEAGVISKQLTAIVRNLDSTRPITAACNFVSADNKLLTEGNLDLVGINYSHGNWPKFPQWYPNRPVILTETNSALATRGSYDMPSDVIKRWPQKWDEPLKDGNPDYSCSSYDNCSAPWGSTHAETWRLVKKHDYLSGMFIWTGWDYLGEPTPYPWPAISSYFGVIDLAGFPKDTYYFYQSEWTTKPMLHLFPHWNWKPGAQVDVWAYFNGDEVELFLNGRSLGTKRKTGDDFHVMWRVPFEPGTLQAVSRRNGKIELTKQVRSAGPAAKILLNADRRTIKANGTDLSFVSVSIVDQNGVIVPDAANIVRLNLNGVGFIAGLDNGNQISHEPFKTNQKRVFHGQLMALVQSNRKRGKITVRATSEGLAPTSIVLTAQ